MQTNEQRNSYARERYLQPGMKEKASSTNRLQYLKNHPNKAECNPDYGLIFNAQAVQTTLTNWGG